MSGLGFRGVVSRLVAVLPTALVGYGLAASMAPMAAGANPLPRPAMTTPRLTSAHVDWGAAVRTLTANKSLEAAARHVIIRSARQGEPYRAPAALARLNAAMANRFPGIARSPIPVLLPFDTDLLLQEVDAGQASTAPGSNLRYLFGLQDTPFFYPGPSGYDAVVVLRRPDIVPLSDIRLPEPFQIPISGSLLLYDLPDHKVSEGDPVSELEDELPGIRRLIHEHHLRYTFVRFGVPYVVSIACFNAGVSRLRMPTCRDADLALRRVLRSLRVAGGTPQPPRTLDSIPISRPPADSETFSFRSPGRLLPGTGFRGHDGRADRNVYSQIRFPMADAPAYVNSQLFQQRNRPTAPGERPNYAYPWRDSFCERRGFSVGQCPAGYGHQGQDLRPALCDDGQYKCRPHDLVAVRDGAIMRSSGQEALYLFVNTETEHLRFRYLHMDPRRMDADQVLSGRLVNEGEVVGQMSNFSRRSGGTSFHLHFDVQVPTKNGWVFVNPYMTLVAAYERMIGGRGTEVPDVSVAPPEPTATPVDVTPVPIAAPPRATPSAVKRDRVKRRHVSSRRPAHQSAKRRSRR